jgi:hypothetical protein
LLRTSSDAWYAYWELEGGLAEGSVIEVVAWVPRVIGAARIARRVRVTRPSGGTTISGLGARAVVRAALGSEGPRGFAPRAIASVLDRTDDSVSFRPPVSVRASVDFERRAEAAFDSLPS